MNSAIVWQMITGEYPPQAGGVSDYSRMVARGLAVAGDAVHVYAPRSLEAGLCDDDVLTHHLPGHFGMRTLAQLSCLLRRHVNGRLLIQYVPHAFGFKAMNLPFCLWLYAHTRIYGGATVIFHEVNFEFRSGDPARYRLLQAVTKVMARLVARSAAQIFVVTPVWESRLRDYIPHDQLVTWLPVPSNISVVDDRTQIAKTRRRYVPGCGPIVGHFGTYPPSTDAMLRAIISSLIEENPDVTILLIGANSESFQASLVRQNANLEQRMVATGVLSTEEVSVAISCCDVMIQPYPDGVTSRRGSMMAALEHGRAIVTTRGLFTEPLWQQSGAVVLVGTADADDFVSATIELLTHETRRRSCGNAAKVLYANRFDLRYTLEALRNVANA